MGRGGLRGSQGQTGPSRSGVRRGIPGPTVVQSWYLVESADNSRWLHHAQPARPVGILEKIRKERNYSWMDIITICKDKLPNYEEKIKMFYKEHLHLDDEIRCILDASGYLDVRDKEDRWIRIFREKGDMTSLLAGIYHRFMLDEKNYLKAMRLLWETLCGPRLTGWLTTSRPLSSTWSFCRRWPSGALGHRAPWPSL